MDAQGFIDTVCRKGDDYVKVTFPATEVGLRCLKNIMAYGEPAGMIPSAADRNEIRNVLLVGWATKTSFCFLGLCKIDRETLSQLARDVVSAH